MQNVVIDEGSITEAEEGEFAEKVHSFLNCEYVKVFKSDVIEV